MHPYVYKKQHKPLLAVFRVFIFIMILCPVHSVGSQSCNFAVKKVKIYSEFSKGFIRIEHGNKVIAKKCTENCTSDIFYIYTVTIDKHYMLLYHIKSSKFICWNKNFKRLIGKKNPANLSHCKFEEKPSINKKRSSVRYTTVNLHGREIEIRFLKRGTFPTEKRLTKCSKHYSRPFDLRKLYPKEDLPPEDKRNYQKSSNCASPDFLPDQERPCFSYLSEFCTQMKNLKDNGHNISFELTDLCKNEWKRN